MLVILLLAFVVIVPIAVDGTSERKCALVALSVKAYACLYDFNNNIENYVSM